MIKPGPDYTHHFPHVQFDKKQQWTLKVQLITKEQLEQLPNGTRLITVNGTTLEKGVDYLDLDTRGDFLAYGLLAF